MDILLKRLVAIMSLNDTYRSSDGSYYENGLLSKGHVIAPYLEQADREIMAL